MFAICKASETTHEGLLIKGVRHEIHKWNAEKGSIRLCAIRSVTALSRRFLTVEEQSRDVTTIKFTVAEP
jgi:hypothetical protein